MGSGRTFFSSFFKESIITWFALDCDSSRKTRSMSCLLHKMLQRLWKSLNLIYSIDHMHGFRTRGKKWWFSPWCITLSSTLHMLADQYKVNHPLVHISTLFTKFKYSHKLSNLNKGLTMHRTIYSHGSNNNFWGLKCSQKQRTFLSCQTILILLGYIAFVNLLLMWH